MNSMPLLITEDDSPLLDIDHTGVENIPVLHLSTQEYPIDFDINDFINFGDVSESFKQIVENPTVSQLSPSKYPSSTLPLGVDKKSRTTKRKVTDTSSSTVTEFKHKKQTKSGVREKRPTTKSDRSKKSKGVSKEMKGNLKAESLSSFSPLQRFGDMKKKAKCRLIKAQMAIAEHENSERDINTNNEALQELDAKIALAKVELTKMCKSADELRSKIAKDSQFNQRSKMRAQAELEESTQLYKAALLVRDNWRKELERAFQSDSD